MTDSGRGNYVIVDHGNGVTSHYFHLSAFGTNREGERLSSGDRVGAGSQLGAVGTTGNSTGDHLHLEIHQGANKVDPVVWLEKNKKGNPAPRTNERR